MRIALFITEDDFELVHDCLEELIIHRRESGINITHVQEVIKRLHASKDLCGVNTH